MNLDQIKESIARFKDNKDSQLIRVGEANLQIADELRNYSKSQVNLWQRIPYLALQAQGGRGYSNVGMRVFEYGLLAVSEIPI